jgi:hypothetical protein
MLDYELSFRARVFWREESALKTYRGDSSVPFLPKKSGFSCGRFGSISKAKGCTQRLKPTILAA